MVLTDLVRRKLAALLRPWLRQEPELELKLGFLRSNGIAKDLSFDTSSLNQSLDESTRFSFKEIKVEQLALNVSTWSFPAFTISVHGLHVTLSLWEVKRDGGVGRRRKSNDNSMEDKKKVLSEIDPQGCALHATMEKIADTISSRNWTTSFLNAILKHCRLQIHDVHLLVQSSIADEPFSCFSKIMEINAESQFIKHGCILNGVISSCFVPWSESSLVFDIRGFETGSNYKDCITHIVPLTDLVISVELKDLQLKSLSVCVPKLKLLFSPSDLYIIRASNAISSKEANSPRNGRLLWEIAARRISSLISTPRYSLGKVVDSVCLWLRYVRAYENLLALVGYPVDNMIKKSAIMMSRDKIFSRSVRHHWEEISEFEKKLPAEAIAQARRIIRCRVASNAQWTKDSGNNPLVNNQFKFFWKMLHFLIFIWSIVCIVFKSILHFFFLQSSLADHPKCNSGVVSEDSCPKHCFFLNVGEFLITVNPANALQPPVGRKPVSGIGISYPDLLSFRLSVDVILVRYTENLCERSFSFYCGSWKVVSFLKESKKKVHDSQTSLWGEPAQIIYSTSSGTSFASGTVGTSVPILERLIEEMLFDWKEFCNKIEGSKIQDSKNPCLMFEIKYSLTDQSLKDLSMGFLKCSLAVEKLNFFLGYSSIVSISALLRQIKHALCWTDSAMGKKVVVHTSITTEDPPVLVRNGQRKSYFIGTEMVIPGMLPEMHIQVGALLVGPHIQISLRKEGSHTGNADLKQKDRQELHLSFDVHNVEFVVSPTSRSDFAALAGYTAVNNTEPECLWLKEPQKLDIPLPDSKFYNGRSQISLNAYLKVQGLNAFLGEISANQKDEIIVLNPTTVKLSLLREDLHSFGATVVAISAALHSMATGITILLFLDELFVLVEAVFGLCSAVSHPFTTFDLAGVVNCQELIRQEVVFVDVESEGSLLGGTQGASSIYMNTIFVANNISELKSLDIVLHNSRKTYNIEDYVKTVDGVRSKKLAMHDLPDYGICILVQQSFMDFSFKDGKVEVLIDVSEVRSVVFRFVSEVAKSSGEFAPDQFRLENLLLHSLNCLYEVSIPRCTFSLWLGLLQEPSGSVSNGVDASTSGGKVSHMVEDSPRTVDTERYGVQSFSFGQKLGFTSNILAPPSSHWLHVNIALSEVYLAGCPEKNILVGAHNLNKLDASLSVGRQFQAISCQTQGGVIFLETTALVIFVHCFTAYCQCINNLLFVAPSSGEGIVAVHGKDLATMGNYPTQETTKNILQEVKWEQLVALTIDLSHLSFVLVTSDESGKLQELLFEADIHLSLEVANMRRKFSFDILKLSILSQVLRETMEQRTKEIQTPHVSSVMTSGLSGQSTDGNSTIEFEHRDRIHSVDSASCSSTSVSQKESHADNLKTQVLHLSPQNYILKELSAFVAVEQPMARDVISPMHINQAWVGSGSISGFDITVSLPEIQMVLFAVESLSGVFSKETTNNVEQRQWSSNHESERSLQELVSDGAIVAIQDVHQHMYIAVEGADSKYSLVGTTHYSLVGERALFRVKYHNPRLWKSPVQWFSLISLHAKSDSGESLKLNFRPGSGFVDISRCNDSGWALWRMLPYKPQTYEGDTQLESYSPIAKKSFYLVNKKNDCGIAFVDGVFEFVGKPGNPFKWKVFPNPSLAYDNLLPDSYAAGASRTNLLDLPMNEDRNSEQIGKLSCINVTIDKVTLTIVHELADTREKLPLLQGSINTTDFVVQILCTKARIMSRLEMLLYYFDAQRNLWREFVHPVEICIFYRFRFNLQVSENVSLGLPVHFNCNIKELSISITELSLDILLFVIGKLNLAGPYAIRNSVVLANCCKVENMSGLTLLCHFYDNEDASIANGQSTTIFLRHLSSVNQPPEASFFSIQLTDQGAFSTSPIRVSLSEERAFAWRTRIVSLQDSKTYPGPFVVVEISDRSEDGVSIVVSPLLRIQNETDYSMELRFQRPKQKETDVASVVLNARDTIDDSMAAFGAINLSGGLKKALVSLSVGNFLYSFRPRITEDLGNFKISLVEWSEDLKGGKAIPLSGIFDKLSYRFRRAFSVESEKFSLITTHCSLKSEAGDVANLHFLIQSIGRNIPVVRPDNFGYASESRNSPVALQEQKEIFILPTVQVSNLLHSEIHVNLTDTDALASVSSGNLGNQATIPCGSTVNFYANPATLYFVVTLTAFNSSCKPVTSGDWVKKLQKQKNDVRHLDIELNFAGAKYFASLRLSRGQSGILEAAIFTSYTLKNDTNFSLFCFAANQKPLLREEAEKLGSRIRPDLGSFLPPMSSRSWFLKHNRLRLKLLEEKACEAQLDLDALSGITEIDLEVEEGPGFKNNMKLGVALRPHMSKAVVPSQIVSMNPRYVVINESEEVIIVRQCYLENDMEGMITIHSKQKTALRLRKGITKNKETNILENFLRKHINALDDSLLHIQFRPNEAGLGWSGPVCVASLGRFFLKFRRSLEFPVRESAYVTEHDKSLWDFAAVHVVEEGSTLLLHFNRSSKINLPYRIENCLRDASIVYYQKGSSEPENLRSGGSVNYVWDDLTLPHKLVVQIDDVRLLREINLDKVRPWKPFYRFRQHRGLGFHLPLDKNPEDQKGSSYEWLNSLATVKLGYEVYADGLTRVLRICEFSDNRKGDTISHSSAKMQLRITYFALNLLEHAKQEIGTGDTPYTGIIVMRLRNINLDSIFTNQHKFNQIRVQSLSVDQKWIGAPFAAMLRRRQSDYRDTNDDVLHFVLILLQSSSNVKQVKYSSIVLQPLDLNLDEETLMRIVPFWRTSLSDSNTSSQQYYFDHFEIHPIKIVASFLPGDSYSSYSSTQETLRSLVHSVIKIPAIKNNVVELNGVLVTHALITLRELSIKCAQHYSWYAMRAIYIAKGSLLLPPAFTSIFDDLASSSLDLFFDPSSGQINLPGLTLGTFKFISKCVDGRGFSGTKRYFGDLGKTLKTAGSNILFAAVTEISDSVLKGAEASGFSGMVSGFHQGILKLAMEPSVLGNAFVEGGPDRKIKLDQSPGIDELYIEGYLQAMLDTMYKQEYLRVSVMDNQVVLKNLPPNSSLIDEIMERVKGVLVSKALLKGEPSRTNHPLSLIRGGSEWKIGPTVLTLCEHLFVSFAIRMLRRQSGKVIARVKWKDKTVADDEKAIIPAPTSDKQKVKSVWKWGIGKFVFSGIVAYIDGRLCRSIPNPVARRIVSGFLLSFLDKDDNE
ncbi:unnamed protein product [Ilex paraguariensis]|uniref:Vacuolar protein sorting-associated protein 13 VPS13 adaptor binding domain-containing protein n=1 Tax=Ilex paraguariensis TaxID=185542 RepID=A0ABC8S2U2_9AQUA